MQCTQLAAKAHHLPLQSNDMEGVLKTLPNNWQMWCRLCAKEDSEGNVHVLLKNEQPANTAVRTTGENMTISGCGRTNDNFCLVDFVEKHFSVQITSDDPLPKMLCTECFSLVTSLANFSERVAKVQQMLISLKDSTNGHEVDTHIVRLKYGLLDEDRGNLFIHKTQPEVHYFETTLNSNKRETHESDEILINPLEPLIKTETILADVRHKKNKKVRYEDGNNDDEDDDDDDDDDYGDGDSDFDIGEDILKNEASESSESVQSQGVSNSKFEQELRDLKEPTKKRYLRKRQPIRNESTAHDSNESHDDADLPCTECPRKFKDKRGLQHHLTRAHSERPQAVELACPQCPLVFKSKYRLKKHLVTTHKSYVKDKEEFSCSYCGKLFGSKYVLKVHIKNVHKDERPYVCDKCGVGRRTRSALREHMTSHTSDAPFKCEICEKRFKAKYQLKRHMDTHDPNKHICAICGLQLNSRRILRDHLLVHSDKMSHKCDYCGRAFKRSNNLKHHLLSHTGIKPYCCNFCDRSFSCNANCRLHMKKIHPEKFLEGGHTYTLNMPRLEVLKAISKTADNLAPVTSGPACKVALKIQKDE